MREKRLRGGDWGVGEIKYETRISKKSEPDTASCQQRTGHRWERNVHVPAAKKRKDLTVCRTRIENELNGSATLARLI